MGPTLADLGMVDIIIHLSFQSAGQCRDLRAEAFENAKKIIKIEERVKTMGKVVVNLKSSWKLFCYSIVAHCQIQKRWK